MAHREDQRLQLNKDEQVHSVSLDLIKANPYQPRKHLMNID